MKNAIDPNTIRVRRINALTKSFNVTLAEAMPVMCPATLAAIATGRIQIRGR